MSFVTTLGTGVKRVAENPRILERWKSDPLGLFRYIVAHYRFDRSKVDTRGFVDLLAGKQGADLWNEQSPLSYPYGFLYYMIRGFKPNVVVETGVHQGRTTLCTLSAMEKNGFGALYSIELGSQEGFSYQDLLPREQIGSLVPQYLRKPWNLVWGDSKKELPALLERLGEIDVFLHDSLHTDEHMLFEYRTAWKHLRKGGLLLSDDIGFGFLKFAREVKHPYACFGGLHKIGGIRKDR